MGVQVVANAVAALTEIAESNPSKNYFELTSSTLHKLLTALNECTECAPRPARPVLAVRVRAQLRVSCAVGSRVSEKQTNAGWMCRIVVIQAPHSLVSDDNLVSRALVQP